MATHTYTTLEEIKASNSDLFGSEQWDLRPEQRDAIDYAKEHFCKHSGRKGEYVWTVLPKYQKFLWNAKMRFGKSICAMELVREMGVKRTLIVTHRPVVADSWFEAFNDALGTKIRGNEDILKDYAYGSKNEDETSGVGNYYDLEKFVDDKENRHYVFFVSMQYLRLSELVNDKTLAKNKVKEKFDPWGYSVTRENEKLKADILNTDWDLVVIDEAHEGTTSPLGRKVIDEYLIKENTKLLHLSGTPFNLYDDFEDSEIYTWDYVAEQQAKRDWEIKHPGEKNPYAELPKLNILTYDITNNIQNVLDHNGIFSFSEFFRTWTGNPKADKAVMPEGARGRFVHEEDVKKFLTLLATKDAESNFPFSTDEYRKMFRHTLWVVTHVDEAAALAQLLREHPIFRRFNIINVAGSGDERQQEDALKAVKNAIGEMPERTSTITISCGRLTTGVTVRPWTAVLYLKGGDGPATYMQTIFRVQSPYTTPDGKMKTSCYVFDFAPDRTLSVVAHTAKFTSMAKAKEANRDEDDEDITQEARDKQTLSDFIELCPVISMDGGKMTALDVNTIYKQMDNPMIDRLIRKGFDDPCLYNQAELNKINPEIINHIGENGGKAADESRKEAKKTVDLSHMTDAEREAWEAKIKAQKAAAKAAAEKKAKKDKEFAEEWERMSEAEKEEWLREEAEKAALREKRKEERKEFQNRMTNIRGISLRIPLLMFGGADAGDTSEDITVDNFTRKIKDESWAEFMPKGVSKEDFNKIKKCFNATRFEEAGKKYRSMTMEADSLHVSERIKMITQIFSWFRNPDKETVLTPWRVVNKHMSETIGGYCFYDKTFDDEKGLLEEPEFIDNGEVTKQLFDNVDLAGEIQTKVLEINSKTGLYPLYVTYSLFRRRMEEYIKHECIDPETITVQEEQVVWDDIVTENMYVICNTPMAVGITRRTLFGFREVEKKANIKAINLIEQAIEDRNGLVKLLKSVGFWKGTTSKQEMKFDAIVGNPPYMLKDNGDGAADAAAPIYQVFVNIAKQLSPNYISMIMPSKWMVGGRAELTTFLNDMKSDKRILKIVDYRNDRYIFPTAHNDGGICYLLWDSNKTNNELEFHHFTIEGNEVVSSSLGNRFSQFIIRDTRVLPILEKIFSNYKEEIPESAQFSSLVSRTRPFGIRKDLFNSPENYPDSEMNIMPFANSVHIYGVKGKKGGAKRIDGHINKAIITDRYNAVNKFKIFFTTTYSSDALTPPDIIRGYIDDVCTETFLLIGPFDKKEQMESCASYIDTNFFKFLLYLGHGTMQVNKSVFSFIPIVEFDRIWSDAALYEEFELSDEEILYIENLMNAED